MGKSTRWFVSFIVSMMIATSLQAQYANKKVRPKHKAYTDSLKQMEYNYTFPALARKTYKKGFDIPYPGGAMLNFIHLTQNILIDNLQLGLKTDNQDLPLTPVDIVGFGENLNRSYSLTFRPDLWVFPFLNVYGLFGTGRATTDVSIVEPIIFNALADQRINTVGFGLLLAAGVGPVWFSADANFTWNFPELLDNPVNTNVVGLRVGHTWLFDDNRPDRNIAFWIGTMYASLASTTVGSIKLRDALPEAVWDRRDQVVQNYYNWYNGLDPNKITDRQKIRVADEILTPIVQRLEAADGDADIRYSLDKSIKYPWNGLIGMQFQLDKHWQFRSEVGFIGNRSSYMLSLNYRFQM